MISFVRRGSVLIFLAATQLLGVVLHAQETRITLERKGQTIVLEPYAPNILRVTLSLKRESALAPPGYGLVGTPAASGWNASQTDEADLYRSARIVASVDRDHPRSKPPLQTETDIRKFFNGSTPHAHITLRTPEGKTLLELIGWSQSVPNTRTEPQTWPATGVPPTRNSTWWARRLPRRTTSTTTAWDRIRRDSSIIAGIRFIAGQITRLRPRPASACRSW